MKILDKNLQLVELDELNFGFTPIQEILAKINVYEKRFKERRDKAEFKSGYHISGIYGPAVHFIGLNREDILRAYGYDYLISTIYKIVKQYKGMDGFSEIMAQVGGNSVEQKFREKISEVIPAEIEDKFGLSLIIFPLGYLKDEKYSPDYIEENIKELKKEVKKKVIEEWNNFEFINKKDLDKEYKLILQVLEKEYDYRFTFKKVPREYLYSGDTYSIGNFGFYVFLSEDERNKVAKEHAASMFDDLGEGGLQSYYEDEEIEIEGDTVYFTLKKSYNLGDIGGILASYDGEEHHINGHYLYRLN